MFSGWRRYCSTKELNFVFKQEGHKHVSFSELGKTAGIRAHQQL